MSIWLYCYILKYIRLALNVYLKCLNVCCQNLSEKKIGLSIWLLTCIAHFKSIYNLWIDLGFYSLHNRHIRNLSKCNSANVRANVISKRKWGIYCLYIIFSVTSWEGITISKSLLATLILRFFVIGCNTSPGLRQCMSVLVFLPVSAREGDAYTWMIKRHIMLFIIFLNNSQIHESTIKGRLHGWLASRGFDTSWSVHLLWYIN